MKDNSVGLIVVGLIAFLAIVVTGKWLLDKKEYRHRDHDHERVVVAPQQPVPPAPQPQPPQQIIVVPPQQPVQPPVIVLPPQYPHHHPNCHNSRDFWNGYQDGYQGRFANSRNPEYREGYATGEYDRRLGRPYYYERYFREPNSGFSLRIPGFRLDIK